MPEVRRRDLPFGVLSGNHGDFMHEGKGNRVRNYEYEY